MAFTYRWILIKQLFIALIRLYQWTISPVLGKCCRFYPSCSEYCAGAIQKHGALRGVWLGVKRIAKCGPWHKGGVDEIP